MKSCRLIAVALLICFVPNVLVWAQDDAETGAWKSLFNGKDLTGWKVKINGYELNDNFGDTFRVENGVLTVSYDKYDKFNSRFGHIFYESPFSHYLLRVEYRFVGQQCRRGPGGHFETAAS